MLTYSLYFCLPHPSFFFFLVSLSRSALLFPNLLLFFLLALYLDYPDSLSLLLAALLFICSSPPFPSIPHPSFFFLSSCVSLCSTILPICPHFSLQRFLPYTLMSLLYLCSIPILNVCRQYSEYGLAMCKAFTSFLTPISPNYWKIYLSLTRLHQTISEWNEQLEAQSQPKGNIFVTYWEEVLLC